MVLEGDMVMREPLGTAGLPPLYVDQTAFLHVREDVNLMLGMRRHPDIAEIVGRTLLARSTNAFTRRWQTRYPLATAEVYSIVRSALRAD